MLRMNPEWRFESPGYGSGDWSDEEFAAEYNKRDPEKVVTPE